MIAKKNSGYDLERKRTAYFSMGLLMAGSLTLAAFTYTSPDQVTHEKQQVAGVELDYMVEEVVYEEPEIEIPKEQDVEMEVQSTPQIDVTAAANEFSKAKQNSQKMLEPDPAIGDLTVEVGDITVATGDIDIDIVHTWVDQEAEFVGGYKGMMTYITSNIDYPQDAIEAGDQGRVYLNFIVEKDGSVSNVSVEKGVTTSLDREAKRLVQSFPNWIPGELDARPVRTKVRLPIVFVLD